jgi:hypothetical protein
MQPFTLAMFRESRVQGARYHLARMQAGRADAEARYADQPHALQAERAFWNRAEANARAALISARALALCNDDADAAFALTFGESPDAIDAKLTAMEAANTQQEAA